VVSDYRRFSHKRQGDLVMKYLAGFGLRNACVVFGVLTTVSALGGISSGIAWLESAQNSSGSWGSEYEFSDTAAAVDALSGIGSSATLDGAFWIAYRDLENHDEIAQEIIALAGVSGFAGFVGIRVDELLAARCPAIQDPSLESWPGGGWGIAPGYDSDCMTTALALSALNAAGQNAGFSVTNRALAAGTSNVHEWAIPPDATTVRLLITISGSEIRLRMTQGRPPTGADPYFPLFGGPYLLEFPRDLPFTPGQNYIEIQSTGGAGTYSLTASYQTPTFDTRTLAEPLSYLIEAQNSDRGWGLEKGGDSELYTTLHVLLALLDFKNYESGTAISNGIAYVRGFELADKTFGYTTATIPYVTALATRVLVRNEAYPFSAATRANVAALEALQRPEGSWGGEPYDTAMAILALWDENQAPAVSAGPDQVVDDADNNGEESVLLSGSANDVDGTVVGYTWSEDGRTLAITASATVMLGVGSHTLTFTAKDDIGWTGTDTVFITVQGRDTDSDGVPDFLDNCSGDQNPDQADYDRDGLGDACDPDDDDDGVGDGSEVSLLLTDPRNVDTDGDGITDGEEDFDFDGRSNASEVLSGTSPLDPDIELFPGLNIFSYPVAVPSGLTAFELLEQIGPESDVESIRRLVPATQRYEEARYEGGVPSGVDFPILDHEGYLIEMLVERTFSVTGSPACPTLDLVAGVNLIGFSCVPAGYSTHSLLADMGDEVQVASVQMLDPATGQFRTTAYRSGSAAGSMAQLHAGQGILVYMKQARSGIGPPIGAPTVEVTYPLDGGTVSASPITVMGTIDDPTTTVHVNGIRATVSAGTFSAVGVALTPGVNTILAFARSRDNLTSSDSVEVTFSGGPVVDYTLGRPDSVSDTRSFNVGAGVLASIASVGLSSPTGLPYGVDYVATTISIDIPTGDVDAPFEITTTADAAVGIHSFQIVYSFYDGSDALITSYTLDFTIEVLP
jgi:hypothetical protein